MSQRDRHGQRIDGGGPWVRQKWTLGGETNPENLVVMPPSELGNSNERVSLQVANPIQLTVNWIY